VLVAIFDTVWEAADGAPARQGPSQPSAAERHVLRLLATGLEHDAIARTLGISVRTVRRRISEIYLQLNAASPFQAGTEAVRQGWL
jgi:DNA-binding NarL/FixJ family response regulator